MKMMWYLAFLLTFLKLVYGELACDVCQCTTNLVICSKQGLVTIPDKFPINTAILLLDKNNLKKVPGMKFAKLKRLRKLDLSWNPIARFARSSFKGLANLQELYLASINLMNHPETLSDVLFQPLRKLKKLWLNNNHPQSNSTYPDQALKHLRMLEELHIDGLPSPFGPGFRSLSRLKKLSLSDDSCDMQRLKNSTFEHVSHITHLNVSNCKILDTETSTFSPLKRIYDLDISGNNRLGFKKVAKALQGLSESPIKVLRLNQLHQISKSCSKLSYDLVQPLENTSLTELYLDGNGMINIESKAVVRLPKTVEVLSMRDNRFQITVDWISLGSMPSLRYLDISDLNKWHFFNFDLSSSEIRKGFQSVYPIPVPPRLETAVFSRCYFRGGSIDFSVGKNTLKHISFDHGLLSFIQGAIHGLDELEHLDLSYNIIESISLDALSEIPSLKSLNVSHNNIGRVVSSDISGKLLENSKYLEILNVSKNNINVLPYSIVSGLRDIRIIDLSHNVIEDLDVAIAHLKKLRYVNLADNKILYISSEVRNSLDNVTVNLNSNPLSCTCEHLDFLQWMSEKRHFIEDLNTTRCQYSNGTKVNLVFIDNILNFLDSDWRNFKGIFVISICFLLFIIFLMMSLIMYRHRWTLRRLYYLGPKGRCQDLRINYPNYVYDAFVCYSDEDKSFVINDMVSELEEKAGLKLCIHDRDFIPGSNVISNIVNAIQNSRKTIIVLSPSFLESDWCNYEFNMAETEGVARRENVVVAIMYKHVDFCKMPQNMSAMFIRYSFLEYNINGYDNQIFWSNVCDGIKTPQVE